MFTKDEATKERVGAYVEALEHEKAGYEARQTMLKEGKQDSLDAEQLAARVKGVAAELSRVKKSKAKTAEDS
jgi:hypothetical protein